MRVLVCGGRDYKNRERVWNTLGELRITCVIHGDATGADRLARQFADFYRIAQVPYPAKWWVYGRPAGPIRNQQMLDEGKPEFVVAFPGGDGTADMVRRARAAGVRIDRV